MKVQEVSEELGVRYVLEGSVQRTSDRVRINAQLIDATTGKHLWAERYDRDAKRLFDIQDEIVETIVATLAFEVDAVERERVARKGPENLDAYDYWLRGRDAWFRWTKEANAQAADLYGKAIELDPNWGRPYGYMAWVHVNDARFGWSEQPEKTMELALKMALKAYELNPDDYVTHWTLGIVYLYRRDFDRAIAIDPHYARAYHLRGLAREVQGDDQGALDDFSKAIDLAPEYGAAFHSRATLYAKLGQTEQATEDIQMVTQLTQRNIESFANENNVWRSQHMHLESIVETELNR